MGQFHTFSGFFTFDEDLCAFWRASSNWPFWAQKRGFDHYRLIWVFLCSKNRFFGLGTHFWPQKPIFAIKKMPINKACWRGPKKDFLGPFKHALFMGVFLIAKRGFGGVENGVLMGFCGFHECPCTFPKSQNPGRHGRRHFQYPKHHLWTFSYPQYPWAPSKYPWASPTGYMDRITGYPKITIFRVFWRFLKGFEAFMGVRKLTQWCHFIP